MQCKSVQVQGSPSRNADYLSLQQGDFSVMLMDNQGGVWRKSDMEVGQVNHALAIGEAQTKIARLHVQWIQQESTERSHDEIH